MNKTLRMIIKKTYYTLRFKPFIQPVSWNDTKFNFYISSFHSFDRSTGCIGAEPLTINWIESFFDENDVFYDIGANIGLFSLYAGVKSKSKVFAFEPLFHNFSTLNRNIVANNLENVTAYCMALHDKTTVDKIYLGGLDEGDALASFKQGYYEKESKYSQGSVGISVDDLTEHILFPNHIKIDVDGNEPIIVKGMKETLKDKRLKSVLIELSDNISKKDTKEIVDLFVKNGFGIYDISEDSDNNHIFLRLD